MLLLLQAAEAAAERDVSPVVVTLFIWLAVIGVLFWFLFRSQRNTTSIQQMEERHHQERLAELKRIEQHLAHLVEVQSRNRQETR